MKLKIFLIALVAFAASSALSQTVRFNFDTKADFDKFKTYKWVPIKNAAPVQDLTDEQIKNAFDAELAKKNLTKVDGETADLLIGYQFGVQKEQAFGGYSTDWGHGGGFETDAWHGSGEYRPPETLYKGELALDIYATSNHTLVWRGVANKTVNPNAEPEARQKHLLKAVKKLLEYYPPTATGGH